MSEAWETVEAWGTVGTLVGCGWGTAGVLASGA